MVSVWGTDVSKPVLKTISAMDLDKINMDLVESLLEWIVDGPHNYPPGKTGEKRERSIIILYQKPSVELQL